MGNFCQSNLNIEDNKLELKRCPFCNNLPRLVNNYVQVDDEGNDIIDKFFVRCDHCGLETEVAFVEDECIKAWNYREFDMYTLPIKPQNYDADKLVKQMLESDKWNLAINSTSLLTEFNPDSPITPLYQLLKVKDLIDTIFSHNEIICLSVPVYDTEDTVTYSQSIWRGHAHELPEEFGNYIFLRIKGVVAENITKSDTIWIECYDPKSNPLANIIS